MANKITKLMLNGEEYLIREYQGGWQPGANTVAYYPLTTNADDESGNGNNIVTSGASSYTTDGALLPNSNHVGLLIPFSINTSNNYTFSWYGKCISTNAGRSIDIYLTNSNTGRLFGEINTTAQNYYYSTRAGGGGEVYLTIGGNADTRYYYTITLNNGTLTYYINGSSLGGGTLTTNLTSSYFRFGNEFNLGADRHWYGYMKDIIIEDKAWTDTEITDYYNQTKSLYGIS